MLEGEDHARAEPFLGKFKYAGNICYLHSDTKLMPKKKVKTPTHPPTHPPTHLSIQPIIHSTTQSSTHPPTHPQEAWGSWNYIGSTEGIKGKENAKPVFVTYWLNQLQNLKTDTPMFVSLNPSFPPDPSLTHRVLNEVRSPTHPPTHPPTHSSINSVSFSFLLQAQSPPPYPPTHPPTYPSLYRPTLNSRPLPKKRSARWLRFRG